MIKMVNHNRIKTFNSDFTALNLLCNREYDSIFHRGRRVTKRESYSEGISVRRNQDYVKITWLICVCALQRFQGICLTYG